MTEHPRQDPTHTHRRHNPLAKPVHMPAVMLSRKLLTAGALLLLLLTSTMASNNAELPSDGYTKTVVTEGAWAQLLP